jgi:hypothetical protein
MNARTKLKRADQARKRRAKMTKPGWTKVSKQGAAVTLWEKDMVRTRPLISPTSEPKPTQKYVSEMLDKLLGHTRY